MSIERKVGEMYVPVPAGHIRAKLCLKLPTFDYSEFCKSSNWKNKLG
jgi:hypothetical protein